MTNEEAKGRLESFIDTFNICKEHDNALVAVSISKEDVQAFTQAIKALEQQPCEDAVNRQAVHDLIAELLSDYLHDEDREKIEELDVKIEDLPPVTPKEKIGHWIEIKNKRGTVVALRCSHCGNSPKRAISSDFCPNCGARMVI